MLKDSVGNLMRSCFLRSFSVTSSNGECGGAGVGLSAKYFYIGTYLITICRDLGYLDTYLDISDRILGDLRYTT